MIDSIIYFVKEYFAIIFYILIIFNIVIRVIVTKKIKKKKNKSRKGGGSLSDIWHVLLCIITFGLSCNFWQGIFKPVQDEIKKLKEINKFQSEDRKYWSRIFTKVK